MKVKCEKCGREYDVGSEFYGQSVTCECGHAFFIPNPEGQAPSIALNNSIKVKNVIDGGGGVGSLVCSFVFLALAAILNYASNFLAFLYLPLYLISFVLGIVAMCHRHALLGAVPTLLSLVLPLALFCKNVSDGTSVFEDVRKKSEEAAERSAVHAVESGELDSLPSFMGVKFGSDFHALNPSVKGRQSRDGEVEYSFVNRKPFMEFKRCKVTTSAVSGRVTEVSSECFYQNGSDARTEFHRICAVIENHYGVKEKSNIFDSESKSFDVGDMRIRVDLNDYFNRHEISIRAYSLKMLTVAESERKRHAVSSISAEGL